MKIAISIEHPAWAHQFRAIIKTLQNRDDEVLILAINKDRSFELLDAFGYKYKTMALTTGKGFFEKGWLFIKLCCTYTYTLRKFKPNVLIGRVSPMMAVAAFFIRRPHILYEDSEVNKFSLFFCRKKKKKILTPASFLNDLGSKQERVETYKELFYLHPNIFTPDKELLKKHKINPDENYIIVRFIAWDASHDFKHKGLPEKEKIGFIHQLEKLCRVYISSEAPLSKELEPYALSLPYEYFHHALSFSQLCVSEGASIATEAAILGVHSLYINDIELGYTKELCHRYGLMYNFQHTHDKYERALEKVKELLGTNNLYSIGQEKRKKMLGDKRDINSLYINMVDEIAK